MWFKWREQMGFTRLEFVERAVNEMTGTPSPREQVVQHFGPAAGCLAILLFIPIQIFVSPVAMLVLQYRKAVLKRRIQALPVGMQQQISSEYMEWLRA